MFSIQSMFGKRNKVFELLEASAETAREAATAVGQLSRHSGDTTALMATFSATRKREKILSAQISEELVRSFFSVLDREDVEAMNSGLYRIPKTVEKFAARYVLVSARVQDMDFSTRTDILATCINVVADMVCELRHGLRIGPMLSLQTRLQTLEGDADKLLLEPYSSLYVEDSDPTRTMLAKDLFETIEAAVDKCRDLGNVIYSIVLKNS